MLAGVTTAVKLAHVRPCHSRMPFVRAYPRETQEMQQLRTVSGPRLDRISRAGNGGIYLAGIGRGGVARKVGNVGARHLLTRQANTRH